MIYKSKYNFPKGAEKIELADVIGDLLADSLNKIHGTLFSKRFWYIITEPYINAVIFRKSEMDSVLNDIPPSFQPISAFGFPSLKRRLTKAFLYNIKAIKNITKKNELKKKLTGKDVAIGFHDTKSILEDVDVHLPDVFPIIFKKGDRQKRRNAIKIGEEQNNVYYNNIIRQIPKIYIEHFDEILNQIPLHQPESKVLHVSTLKTFYMSFLVAKYVENGSKLFYYQHGANYGESILHYSHHHESKIADEFRTWGWKINDKDVPWRAYRLIKFRREYLSYPKEYNYDLLMTFGGLTKNKSQEIYETILDRLHKRYASINARPRPLNKLFSHATQLDFIKSNRVTVGSGLNPMAEDMSKSKLILQMAVPSTNFLECIFVDHPTIGLRNNKQPTEVVRPYYDFFIKTGVLHEDISSLVEHLNNVDVDEWWNTVIRHPMYSEFKSTFAREFVFNKPNGTN